MSDGEWVRHTIAVLGISFEANRTWPLETFALPDGEIVYQRLPGDAGAFFVRYGPGQTLDAVVAALGGAYTTKTIETDEPATLAGLPARRVALEVREPGGGTFRDDPPPRARHPVIVTRYVLSGLTIRGTPMVGGYRVYGADRDAYEPALERMLASVARTGPD